MTLEEAVKLLHEKCRLEKWFVACGAGTHTPRGSTHSVPAIYLYIKRGRYRGVPKNETQRDGYLLRVVRSGMLKPATLVQARVG